MDDSDVRVWLVEREYTDKGLVTLVYATTDGEQVLVEQRSANRLRDVTAARAVNPAKLIAPDDEDLDRYANEATRMAERHDPGDAV